MADISNERANAAFERGHVLSAQSNWLRAINYYQASAFDFDAADKKQQCVLRTMRACARRYIAHLTPAGEVVEIPWQEDYPLEGYFLPASAASHRAPVVVCMGDPGHRKEEYLFKVARYARDRGLSLLAVDLLGSGTSAKFDEIVGRPDLEMSVSHVMDYLTTRVTSTNTGWQFSATVRDRPLWRVASLSTIVSPPRFVTAESGICTSAPS
jgi:hypothetical protein